MAAGEILNSISVNLCLLFSFFFLLAKIFEIAIN